MKVKTISVTYGRKFNLGDYESAHIEATAWADLEEVEPGRMEDAATAYTVLWNLVVNEVKHQAAPLLKGRKAQ